MPKDSKREQPLRKGNKKVDFKIIKGIGDALDEWFRASFNVHTYAELAKLSAQKIRLRARRDSIVLKHPEIEQILAQARALAGASKTPARENGKPAASKVEGTPAAPEEGNEWKEFASFVVYFERKVIAGKEEKRTKIERRTAIHHMETAEHESWPGIETDQACQWMLKRLGEKEEIAPEEEAPEAVAPSPVELPLPPTVALEITGIQVIQPPSNDQPQDIFMQNHAFNGYVKEGEPLSFAATFHRKGLGAAESTKSQKEFSVVFNAENLFTSAVTRIGVSGPDFLKEGQLSYTALLSPLTLSRGLYRLQIVAAVRYGKPL